MLAKDLDYAFPPSPLNPSSDIQGPCSSASHQEAKLLSLVGCSDMDSRKSLEKIHRATGKDRPEVPQGRLHSRETETSRRLCKQALSLLGHGAGVYIRHNPAPAFVYRSNLEHLQLFPFPLGP